MAKAGSKKRKIIICIVSIVAVIALLFGACAVYLGDYYHAITPAGESFGLQDGSSLTETIKLDNGNIVCKSENATKGLIFYPGGKVEYTAYLPLMESLAQKGILCVLVRMPFNLAVFDVNAADGIREMFPEITDWYIGGHSLGGSMAAAYLEKHPSDFKGLLLLAAYSTADLSSKNIRTLSIYGSNDGVLNREKIRAVPQQPPRADRIYNRRRMPRVFRRLRQSGRRRHPNDRQRPSDKSDGGCGCEVGWVKLTACPFR